MYYDPLLNFLFGLLIVALIIWVIARIARGPRGRHPDLRWITGHSPALTILEERYAKGEISKEEFDAKRKDLMI